MSLERFKNKINLLYETEPKESIIQQQALSMCAMLSWGNDFPVNTFDISQVLDSEDSKKLLNSSWNIYDRISALDKLEWALNEGHRTNWNENSVELNKEFLNIPSLIKYGVINHEKEIGMMNIDAWDYGRLVHLARLTYHLDYITEEEAWHYISKAFSKIKEIYKTWLDYSKSYILGRYYWDSSVADSLQPNMAHYSMLMDKKSPWNNFPLHDTYVKEYETNKLNYKQINKKNYKKLDGPGLISRIIDFILGI